MNMFTKLRETRGSTDVKWSFYVETLPLKIPFSKSDLAAFVRKEGRKADDQTYFKNADGESVKGKCMTVSLNLIEQPLRENIIKGTCIPNYFIHSK